MVGRASQIESLQDLSNLFLCEIEMKQQLLSVGRMVKRWPFFRMNTFSDIPVCVWNFYKALNRREFNQKVDDIQSEGEAIVSRIMAITCALGPSPGRIEIRDHLQTCILDVYRSMAAFDHHAEMARFGILKYYVRTPILGFVGSKGGRGERQSIKPCVHQDLPPSSDEEDEQDD